MGAKVVWIGLILALAGCQPGDTTVLTPPIFPSADDGDDFEMPVIRFAGAVVSDEVVPVAGARVEFCGFGSTTTDARGNFVFDIARIISQDVYVAISAAGRATRTYRRFVTNLIHADVSGHLLLIQVSDSDSPYVNMRAGADLTVAVTLEGLPSGAGFGVLATPVEVFDEFSIGEPAAWCAPPIVGTTDANGIATLVGLNPEGRYQILVPAQEDGNGVFYNATLVQHTVAQHGGNVSVNVLPVSPFGRDPRVAGTGMVRMPVVFLPTGPIVDDSGLALYGFNFDGEPAAAGPRPLANDADESVSVLLHNLAADGSVQVVLDIASDIVESGGNLEPAFWFRNNLVDPGSTAYDGSGGTETIVPATVTDVLDTTTGSGLVYQFTPLNPLPENEVFRLRFLAVSRMTGDAANLSVTFTKPSPDLPTVSLDNYNGETAGGATAPVYLEFNRIVAGHYKVLAIRQGGTTTQFPFAVERALWEGSNDDSMVYNADSAPGVDGGETGVGVGTFYRVLLRATGTAGAFASGQLLELVDGDVVTVELSVRDAAGNRIQTTLDLPVD